MAETTQTDVWRGTSTVRNQSANILFEVLANQENPSYRLIYHRDALESQFILKHLNNLRIPDCNFAANLVGTNVNN